MSPYIQKDQKTFLCTVTGKAQVYLGSGHLAASSWNGTFYSTTRACRSAQKRPILYKILSSITMVMPFIEFSNIPIFG